MATGILIVQVVDWKFKIGLPRVVRDQFENGKLVTKVYDEKILKKGDRLYFKNDPKRVIKNVNFVNDISYFTVLFGEWALQA